jgi:hypothetical protein
VPALVVRPSALTFRLLGGAAPTLLAPLEHSSITKHGPADGERMGRTKMGRPAEFRKRTPFVVLLEATELAALHRRARKEDQSASAFVRGLILKALAKPTKSKESA